jgi:hypothetical protein
MASNDKHENPGHAFGAPGIEPRWTHSAKEGIGTAYHSTCHVWFTLSHGILNEIYYPTVDQPNTRDVQLLITDGESFCHEEKRDLRYEVDYPERNCLLYRLTNSDPAGRYRIVKHVLADPHRSVVLMHIRLEVADENLRRKLKMYPSRTASLRAAPTTPPGFASSPVAGSFTWRARTCTSRLVVSRILRGVRLATPARATAGGTHG